MDAGDAFRLHVLTPLTVLCSPLWAFRPDEVARVTDWQVLHLYAQPFAEAVRGLFGGGQAADTAATPPAELPPYWDEMVGNLMAAERLDRPAAERKAARLHAALVDLERAQAARR